MMSTQDPSGTRLRTAAWVAVTLALLATGCDALLGIDDPLVPDASAIDVLPRQEAGSGTGSGSTSHARDASMPSSDGASSAHETATSSPGLGSTGGSSNVGDACVMPGECQSTSTSSGTCDGVCSTSSGTSPSSGTGSSSGETSSSGESNSSGGTTGNTHSASSSTGKSMMTIGSGAASMGST